MKLPQRTLYTVLERYMEHYGHLINNPDQLAYALSDINEIMDFAMYKMDTALDADGAAKISQVGLQWIDYIKANPGHPEKFAEQARSQLDHSLS